MESNASLQEYSLYVQMDFLLETDSRRGLIKTAEENTHRCCGSRMFLVPCNCRDTVFALCSRFRSIKCFLTSAAPALAKSDMRFAFEDMFA